MSYPNRAAFSLAIVLYLNKVAFSLFFRIYTQDDFFAKTYIPTPGVGPAPLKEVQVALAFARDYDLQGSHTNGLFTPYWDGRTVTPQLISEFKKNLTKITGIPAKVLASIGDRDPRYAFRIKDGEREAWVSNAIASLTSIVQGYLLDGIDVYYEHIDASQDDFVHAIGKLIEELKSNRTITAASIAPSAALNNEFYVPLYGTHKESIDTVVYQCHNEVNLVPDPETFVKRFRTEATGKYDKQKLLAGYSAIYKDWGKLSPIVYFLGGMEILQILIPWNMFSSAVGTSIWLVAPDLPVSSDVRTLAHMTCAAGTASHITA